MQSELVTILMVTLVSKSVVGDGQITWSLTSLGFKPANCQPLTKPANHLLCYIGYKDMIDAMSKDQ
jgi:hypothetical protein